MKKRLIKICLCLSVAFVLCCSFFGQNVKYNKSYALDIQDNVTFTFNEVSSTMQPYFMLDEYYDYVYDEEEEDYIDGEVSVTPNFYNYNYLFDNYFPNSGNDFMVYNTTVSFTPRLTVEGSDLTLDLFNLNLLFNCTYEDSYLYTPYGFYIWNLSSSNDDNYNYFNSAQTIYIYLYDINFNLVGQCHVGYNRTTHAVTFRSIQSGYSDVTGLNYPRFRFNSSNFTGLSSNYYIEFRSNAEIEFFTSSDYSNYLHPCAYSYLSFNKLVNDISISTFGDFDTSFYEYYKRTGVEASNYYKEDMWKFRGDNSDSNISFSFPSLYNLGTSTIIYDVFDNSNANYNDGYNDGYANGNNVGYNNGYNEGRTTGYNNGYAQGDAVGYSRGVAESNNYSFIGLIGAVIDAPIRAFTGLLNFEILGVNLSGFLLGLFSIALVLFIYRKVKGW